MPSSLVVKVHKVENIQPHPNADRLEILTVDGWETVVKKGWLAVGDLVVYVPPDSLLPEQLGKDIGVSEYLGKDGRVRQIRLRGHPSFGLVFKQRPTDKQFGPGKDVADYYGITKYTPPFRGGKRSDGQRQQWGQQIAETPYMPRYFDVENIKNHVGMFTPDDDIVAFEKIHGRNVRIALSKAEGWIMGSRNVRRKPPVIKTWRNLWGLLDKLGWTRSEPDENLCKREPYTFAYSIPNLRNMILDLYNKPGVSSVVVYGEVYGKGMQSITYGLDDGINVVVFDIMINGKVLPPEEFSRTCYYYGVDRVKAIYVGKFNLELLKEEIEKESWLATQHGARGHIMEGCVIRPAGGEIYQTVEYTREDGSVCKRTQLRLLKLISDRYMFSKTKEEEQADDEPGEPSESKLAPF
jgi:RNA ligase (TIGR02306 family)